MKRLHWLKQLFQMLRIIRNFISLSLLRIGIFTAPTARKNFINKYRNRYCSNTSPNGHLSLLATQP